MRLEFHGSKISSDAGLPLFRELAEVLGLHGIAGGLLRDTRTGHNRLHTLVGLLRQSVFGRLAGYDDVNDADRLSLNPVMRRVVGGQAVEAKATSASQMGRFETEVLAEADNRAVRPPHASLRDRRNGQRKQALQKQSVTACPKGLIGAQNSDAIQEKAFYLGNVGLKGTC